MVEVVNFNRARSIGHIWLLWIRVHEFDWPDPDPDPLDRDLVNPATVQYNCISRWQTKSAGAVAVRLRTSCSSCWACSIRIQSSQIRPIECALSVLYIDM